MHVFFPRKYKDWPSKNAGLLPDTSYLVNEDTGVMEPEGLPDFKAIRAKFQEEITLNQSRNKPSIPNKPKQVPSVGPSFPLPSALGGSSENRAAVGPKVVLKDTKRCLVFKRPVYQPLPLPPCTPPLFNGDENARCSFRDKRLSLVLPVQPKERKSVEAVLSSGLPQANKQQKRGSFPFKSASPEPIEEPGSTGPFEENVMAESAVALLQLCSNDKSPSQKSDAPASLLLSEEAASGSMSSAAVPRTFNSLKNINGEHTPGPFLPLTSSTSRSAACEAHHPEPSSKLSPKGHDNLKEEFFNKSSSDAKSTAVSAIAAKVNGGARRKVIETLEEIMGSGTKDLQQKCQAETLPPKVPLPSLQCLGPKPEKPPRPAFVDLCPYWATMVNAEVSDLVGAPQNMALAHPKLYRAENKAVDVWTREFPESRTSGLKATEIKGLHPVYQAFSATEPETQEPKVSGLKVLGLWSKSWHSEVTEFAQQGAAIPEDSQIPFPAPVIGSHTEVKQPAGCDTSENVYEDVENVRKLHRYHTWKRKSIPKNPYADTQVTNEDARRSTWFHNPWFGMAGELHNLTHSYGDGQGRKVSPEAHEDKELKKREKHRLERERKEQKEKEKKEQEMKKKFKITGEEEPMYQAKVTMASKGRKGDLPVQIGDVVSIIRTTNCPKGKWLAQDSNNRYGYIPVMNVELDIKEMLELGKKASQAVGRGTLEGDSISEGSRSSNQWNILTSSFTDSEEWTCDEETISLPSDAQYHNQNLSMPETSFTNGKAQLTFSDISSEDSSMLARHEALQRLASFFEQQQEIGDTAENEDMNPTKTEEQFRFLSSIEEKTYFEQDDFQLSDLMILPPPEPYADRG